MVLLPLGLDCESFGVREPFFPLFLLYKLLCEQILVKSSI